MEKSIRLGLQGLNVQGLNLKALTCKGLSYKALSYVLSMDGFNRPAGCDMMALLGDQTFPMREEAM
jgi:hypothetical protein